MWQPTLWVVRGFGERKCMAVWSCHNAIRLALFPCQAALKRMPCLYADWAL